eukprot:m51a1_g14137 putative domain-containing protein (1013) ;mRNA; r:237463-241003
MADTTPQASAARDFWLHLERIHRPLAPRFRTRASMHEATSTCGLLLRMAERQGQGPRSAAAAAAAATAAARHYSMGAAVGPLLRPLGGGTGAPSTPSSPASALATAALCLSRSGPCDAEAAADSPLEEPCGLLRCSPSSSSSSSSLSALHRLHQQQQQEQQQQEALSPSWETHRKSLSDNTLASPQPSFVAHAQDPPEPLLPPPAAPAAPLAPAPAELAQRQQQQQQQLARQALEIDDLRAALLAAQARADDLERLNARLADGIQRARAAAEALRSDACEQRRAARLLSPPGAEAPRGTPPPAEAAAPVALGGSGSGSGSETATLAAELAAARAALEEGGRLGAELQAQRQATAELAAHADRARRDAADAERRAREAAEQLRALAERLLAAERECQGEREGRERAEKRLEKAIAVASALKDAAVEARTQAQQAQQAQQTQQQQAAAVQRAVSLCVQKAPQRSSRETQTHGHHGSQRKAGSESCARMAASASAAAASSASASAAGRAAVTAAVPAGRMHDVPEWADAEGARWVVRSQMGQLVQMAAYLGSREYRAQRSSNAVKISRWMRKRCLPTELVARKVLLPSALGTYLGVRQPACLSPSAASADVTIGSLSGSHGGSIGRGSSRFRLRLAEDGEERAPQEGGGSSARPRDSVYSDERAPTMVDTDTQSEFKREAGRSLSVIAANVVELEHMEVYKHIYTAEMANKTHYNFIGRTPQTPVIVSMCAEVSNKCFLILIRTKGGSRVMLLESSWLKGQKPRARVLQQTAEIADPLLAEAKLQAVSSTEIVKDLVRLEELEVVTCAKFGVVFAKPGQRDEESMLANCDPSPAFLEFLSLLGERVPLLGWQKYAAGLDVTKSATSGTESVYTVHEGVQVMFHVSTLIPFTPGDPQQLNRKRQIGNDVVVVVFKEGDTPFNPCTFVSQFNHVFIVVTPVDKHYRVAVAYKRGVPPFGPSLPEPPVFPRGPAFSKFLLTKLLNAEQAALHAPLFEDKMLRVKRQCLSDIAKKYPTD